MTFLENGAPRRALCRAQRERLQPAGVVSREEADLGSAARLHDEVPRAPADAPHEHLLLADLDDVVARELEALADDLLKHQPPLREGEHAVSPDLRVLH